MIMAVDESRKNQLPICTQALGRHITGGDLGLGPDCDDGVAADRYGSVGDDAALRVHSDCRAAVHQHIDRLGSGLWKRSGGIHGSTSLDIKGEFSRELVVLTWNRCIQVLRLVA